MEEQPEGLDPALRAFGLRLKERREACSLEQADLAKRMGCATNTVYRWESGRQQMGILDLLAAARALETSVQALLDPAAELPAVRTSSLYFVSPQRLIAVHNATTQEQLEQLVPTYPLVGIEIEPPDVQVSADEFKAKKREANAIFDARMKGPLARLFARLRGNSAGT